MVFGNMIGAVCFSGVLQSTAWRKLGVSGVISVRSSFWSSIDSIALQAVCNPNQ